MSVGRTPVEAGKAIEAEAKRLAEKLHRTTEVRTGFGGEIALENAFIEMASFTIGQFTGQVQRATRIPIKEAR